MFKFVLAALLVLVTSACQKTTQSKGAPSLPRPKMNLKEGCVPESQLMARNIVGGTPVSPAETDAKAAVMILATDTENVLGLCTAQLINSKTLLTAAHCLPSAATRFYVIFHPSLSCESGFNLLQDSKKASRVVRHEDYSEDISPEKMKGDIGLLFLSEDAPEGYKPYQIADPRDLHPQHELFLYGFGSISEKGGGSGVMRKATVPAGKFSLDPVENKIMIDQKETSGICVGDSGGASFIELSGEKHILGVNSYVRGEEGNRCSMSGYQVLVHPYKEWIETKIKENSEIKETR